MAADFTLPPDTRALGQGNPPQDVDNIVDALTAMGGGVNVLNAAYSGGADPTGGVASDAAVAAAIPSGAGIVAFPPGTYKFTSGITISHAGVYLAALIPGTVTFTYTGTGDCIRMYSTTGYAPGNVFGGGVLGRIIIDLTSAGTGAAGIHAGDIYRLRFDCGVRNGNGTGQKNFWFDNQYYWAEQITGQIWSERGPVVFDNSANTSGSATGSFDRACLDIFCNNNGKSSLVVFQNGAFIIDGRLGIYGNTDYGSALYYVLSLLDNPSYAYTATNASPCVFTAAGSYYSNVGGLPVQLSGGSPPAGFSNGTTYYVVNASGATFQLAATSGGTAINSTSTGSGTVKSSSYARIAQSVLNIGVECNGTTGTQPGTINFANPAILSTCIQDCTGIIDFSGNNPFAVNSTNWTSNFQFDGPAYGDNNLKASPPLGRGAYVTGAITSGGTINTRFNAVATVAPTSDVAGILMSRDFSVNWREITVINQSAFTLTFAAAGSSFVADGTADVIQALSAVRYAWNPNTGLWYRLGTPAGPGAYLCAPNAYAPASRTAVTVSSTTMAAWSSGNICTNTFTAPGSGSVIVTVYTVVSVSVSGNLIGWALAATGTVTPVAGQVITTQMTGTTTTETMHLMFYVTGLTAGTSYQFDLLGATTSAGTATIEAQGQSSTSLAAAGTPAVMTVQAV